MQIHPKIQRQHSRQRSSIRQVPQSTQKGVVLIESMIAILLFSMGILALVGLQAAMIKNTSENKLRADASFIAQQSIGSMWGDPDNLANYVVTDQVVPTLPSGTRTVAVDARGLVTVTVRWQAPGGDPHSYATSTYIGAL